MTREPRTVQVATFAAALVEPALAELRTGFGELVEALRSNDDLRNAVSANGLDVVLESNHAAVTALQKNNREFVTVAEERAEKAMRDRVADSFPTHGIVGEELGTTAGDEWLWVFDPVDGTSAMIRTAFAVAYGLTLEPPTPAFGITIAVVHHDQPIVGVVAELLPTAAERNGLVAANVWVGATGLGTTCNGTPVTTPPAPPLAAAMVTSTVPEVMFDSRQKWSGFQALRDGTAGVVVDQNCVGFMRLLTDDPVAIAVERDMALPDATALIPVLRSAGIKVTDIDGGSFHFDDAARTQEYTILAAPPQLHGTALAIMQRGVDDAINQFQPNTGPKNGYPKKFS